MQQKIIRKLYTTGVNFAYIASPDPAAGLRGRKGTRNWGGKGGKDKWEGVGTEKGGN